MKNINLFVLAILLVGVIVSAEIGIINIDRTITNELTLEQSSILKDRDITRFTKTIDEYENSDMKYICLYKKVCEDIEKINIFPIYDEKTGEIIDYVSNTYVVEKCRHPINICQDFNSSLISADDKEIEILRNKADGLLNRITNEKIRTGEGITTIK